MKPEPEDLVKGLGPIAVVIVMVIGASVIQSPYRPLRPPKGAPLELPLDSGQTIEARLWQDPLQVIHAHEPALRASFRIELDPNKTMVLAIMVPGDSYAESIESRLRTRYAIQAAFGAEHYTPINDKHLGALTITIPREQSDSDTVLPVSYEWFKKDDLSPPQSKNTPAYVLVLWINEHAVSRQPTRFFRNLADRLKVGTEKEQPLVVIGPRSSDTLIRLWKSSSPEKPDQPRNVSGSLYPHISMISPWATAPIEHLYGFDKTDWPTNFTIVQTNSSDLELVKLLSEELITRRGIDLAEHQVLLVSEWDTLYGRSFPKLFGDAMYETIGNKMWHDLQAGLTGTNHADKKTAIANQVFEHWKIYRRNRDWSLRQIRYLRGLDGDRSAEDSIKPNDDKSKIQWAVGPSQFDYIRRITTEADKPILRGNRLPWIFGQFEKRLDLEPESPASGDQAWPTRVRAVGVLGTDVYDKLVVLQALRRKYPDAIFFTTDLDARVLHPTQTSLTKNMIVASGYGLTLKPGPGYQANLPPFRNSYQTAAYLACRYAIQGRKIDEINPSSPRLFEIGRTRPIDITPGQESSIHPQRPPLNEPTRRQRIYISLAALIILILFTAATGTLWPFIMNWDLSKVFLVILTAVFVMIGWLMYRDMLTAHNGEDEPASLIEGVSVWPTEFLRLLAGYLATAGICYGSSRIKRVKQELARQFGLAGDNAPTLDLLRRKLYLWRSPNRLRWAKNHIDLTKSKHRTHTDDEKSINARLTWKSYLRRSAAGPWLLRALICTALFLLSGFLIMGLMGRPVSPTRGDISWKWNQICLWASVIPFLLLTFFVADATRQCLHIAQVLSGRRPLWPPPTVSSFRTEANIPRAPLRDWMLIQFIAKLTNAVTPLIYLPFIVVIIMIASRNPYLFDRWTWPVQLVVVIGTSIIFAALSSFALRRTAERARQTVLNRLNADLLKSTADVKKQGIEATMDRIRAVRTGAFAPLLQASVVRAIVVVFGGYSGIIILESLAKNL